MKSRILFSVALGLVAPLSIWPAQDGVKAFSIQAVDALGARVNVGPTNAAERAIVIFSSPAIAERSCRLAELIERAVTDRADYKLLLIVDMRKYDHFFVRDLARAELRKSAKRGHLSSEGAGSRKKSAQATPWHFIADFDGQFLLRAGLTSLPNQPVTFVVRGGKLSDPFVGDGSIDLIRAELTADLR